MLVSLKMISTEDLFDIMRELLDSDVDIAPEMPLVGGSSPIDSMSLVQICLALEDKSHSDGFLFDWTSEKAMSSLNSIFKTPETLVSEYNRQCSDSNL